MLDAKTKKPRLVTAEKIAGSYLRLPENQLDQIRQRLDRQVLGIPTTTRMMDRPRGAIRYVAAPREGVTRR